MTLIEVLTPFGVTEDEFVDALSRDLRAAPDPSASRLTESEESLLQEHGGIASPVGDGASVRKATLQSSSSNLAAQTRESLSAEQTATLLMVDGSAVGCGCRPGSSIATTPFPGCARCSRRYRRTCTRSRWPGS